MIRFVFRIALPLLLCAAVMLDWGGARDSAVEVLASVSQWLGGVIGA